MAAHPERLLRHLRRLLPEPPSDPATDAGLLDRFARHNDEDAFRALVTRHGPMVFGVCRCVLRDAHEAEDVAQAAFLVLARKARTIRHPETLAAWLHRTARHLALKHRRSDTRRRQREIRSVRAPLSSPDPLDELTVRELLGIFDEELRRLPEGYRLPLILCCLEGRTQEEAARELGWTPGAVKGRLERGRTKLHGRLLRRGLTLPAGLVAWGTLQGMPAGFVPSTLRAAATFAARAGGDGTVAAEVVAIAEEGIRSMAVSKAKVVLGLLVVLGIVAAGVGALARPQPASGQREEKQVGGPREQGPPKPQAEKQAPIDLHGDALPDGALARLGTLRWRAGSELDSLAYAPDGKTLAAVSRSEVCLFDTATGERLKQFRPPNTFIGRVAFSPDGKRLASSCSVRAGDRNKTTVQIWELPGWRKALEVDGGNVQWLGWSAEGQLLALSLDEGSVLLRELAGGKEKRFPVKDPGQAEGLFACAYAAGGKVLAVPDESRLIRVWDVTTGEQRCALQAKGDYVSGLAFSADGRTLASLTPEAVQLWDTGAVKAMHVVAADQKYLTAIAFAPDGKTLATISVKDARFWDVATGRERGRTREERTFAKAGAFSPDGGTLATVEQYSGAIHLWDAATGERRAQPAGHTNRPHRAAFSPDGRKVATGSMDGTIFLWDSETGRQLAQVRRPYRWVRGYDFSADGRTLYSSWNDDKLYFSDTATGAELHVLQLDDPDRPDTVQSGIHSHLTDDRKTLVTFGFYYPKQPGGGVGRDLLITGWDVTTRKQLFRRSRAAYGLGIAVSPDARMLAVDQGGPDDRLGPGVGRKEIPARGPMRLEDLATGEHLLTFPLLEGQTWPMAFSPDGRLLACNSFGPAPGGGRSGEQVQTLRLWEVASATEVLALPTIDNSRVAFSPDGRLLALSAPEQEILLWDLARGKEWRRIKGFAAELTGLSFSPDGRRLVSGLSDSTLLVWDVAGVPTAGPTGLGPEGAAHAWADLAAEAPKAFAARNALAGSPEQAVPLLKEHLAPAQPPDAARLRRLLGDLDSDQFAVREEARKTLEEMGDLARGALRRAQADNPSLEVRRQVQALLEKLRGPVTRPEALRALRAVAVLEDIATPEARQVLETLAGGEAEARLTQEAKATLKRLARRQTTRP
jgi:RNA polymerase sigma factor (sigma-70 family)